MCDAQWHPRLSFSDPISGPVCLFSCNDPVFLFACNDPVFLSSCNVFQGACMRLSASVETAATDIRVSVSHSRTHSSGCEMTRVYR